MPRSTSVSTNGGNANFCLASSESSRSARFLATCASTSMPAMSTVRNVALFGAADRGSRDGVDLFDRVLAAGQRAKRQDHTMEPEVIGDEVRRVFRNHDAFAQPVIRELPDGLDDRRIRVRQSESARADADSGAG